MSIALLTTIWQIIYWVIGISIKNKENSFVYGVGAVGYALLELLWRGYTHWTMALTGGLCFFLIYKVNSKLIKQHIIFKCAIGAFVITIIELAVGTVINLKFQWNIWNYSNIPYNFLGQICLFYSLLWFALCFPVFKLCVYLRKRLNPFGKP